MPTLRLSFVQKITIGCLLMAILTLGLGCRLAILLNLISIDELVHQYSVSLVPVFPGSLQEHATSYNPFRDGGMALRVLDAEHADIKSVVQFYHQKFSTSPWKLDGEYWDSPPPSFSEYCATFERPIFGGLRLQAYSIDILAANPQSSGPSETTGVRIYIYTGIPKGILCVPRPASGRTLRSAG